MIVFLIFGNRTYKACPKCDAKDGLIDQDGSDATNSPESESIWKQMQDSDAAKFQKNKLVLLAIAVIALLLSIASFVVTTNRN
ncbi:MAG: hypothetical protein ACI9G1_001201 [Pirellulaceae bacterium]|jgi:hypothetical protein